MDASIRPEVRLGPGECSDVETGARFFAALSFPSQRDDQRRDDVAKAMIGIYVHAAEQLDWGGEILADPSLQQFSGLDLQWCEEQYKAVKKRLEERGSTSGSPNPPPALPA